MNEPYCEVCGSLKPRSRSFSKFCCDKCRDMAAEDNREIAAQMTYTGKAYKAQYDRALVSQAPLTEDAIEANRRKMSYGRLMAWRRDHARP